MVILLGVCLTQDKPLTQRYFHTEDMGYDYTRGTYLIVLGDASLESILEDETTGNFIHFKKTQGYKVDVVNIEDIGVDADLLRLYLEIYYTEDPLLEYVLLVGDVDYTYSIPAFYVASYSYDEIDVTDHKYTFFGNDPLAPNFFIGRWPI